MCLPRAHFDTPVLNKHAFYLQVLGKGAFGIVYAAQDKHGTETFACKSIAKAKLVSEVSLCLQFTSQRACTIWECLEHFLCSSLFTRLERCPLDLQEDVKDVQREVQVLKLIGKHENVAELINVFEDSTYVHLVLELCKGGELFDRVVAKGTFTEKMAAGNFLLHGTPCPPTNTQYTIIMPCSAWAFSFASSSGAPHTQGWIRDPTLLIRPLARLSLEALLMGTLQNMSCCQLCSQRYARIARKSGSCRTAPELVGWLADYFRTMVEVVDHLHQLGVMHRDIKVYTCLPKSRPLSTWHGMLKLAKNERTSAPCMNAMAASPKDDIATDTAVATTCWNPAGVWRSLHQCFFAAGELPAEQEDRRCHPKAGRLWAICLVQAWPEVHPHRRVCLLCGA